MKDKRRPIYKKGDRNALCPFYRDCLDEAILNSWDYWACRECRHRLSRDPAFDALSLVDDSVTYYELPDGFREDYG